MLVGPCGNPGALVATVGIFAPAFVFVAVSRVLIPRIRRSQVVGPCWIGSWSDRLA